MAEPFIGEIRLTAFGAVPRGWALCNGQILPIAQNQALFAVLGTTYGGDGRTTFALPNLQGRIPNHVGSGFQRGQIGGAANHTLTLAEMPAHTHLAGASSAAADQTSPAGAVFAGTATDAYSATPTGNLNVGTVGITGGNQAHDNMPPYLAISFMIALQGIFPVTG